MKYTDRRKASKKFYVLILGLPSLQIRIKIYAKSSVSGAAQVLRHACAIAATSRPRRARAAPAAAAASLLLTRHIYVFRNSISALQ